MNNYFIGILILLLSGFAAGLFNRKFKTIVMSVLAAAGSIFCLIPAIDVLSGSRALSRTFEYNQVFGQVTFSIDHLSAFFILVITIMSMLSVIYANGYLKNYLESKNINSHLVFFPMLIASMLLVVTCQNSLLFLVFWEIMSISSFFLVIFDSSKKEVLQAGVKYLIFMHISVIFIIIAFALMSIKSGSFDFASFNSVMQNNTSFANIVFILAFIGFGTKAGFVPFHNWLPEAHPAAPSHVSAVMSGVMIKMGIYGIIRMIILTGTPSKMIAFGVLLAAVISSLYGVLYAISQHDLKKLLAYHSIENIGIIGIGLGAGMLGQAYSNPLASLLGYSGAILHVLNHSIFKELLFLAAGNIYLKTRTKDIEVLGGLIKVMPATAVLFLIGSAAICAFPPLNGFISELLIYLGLFRTLEINHLPVMLVVFFAISGLALVGTMAILCFSKVFGVVFLGMPRSEKSANVTSDCGLSMTIPMGILAVLALLIGVYPQFVFFDIKHIVYCVFPMDLVNLMQVSMVPLNIMQIVACFAILFIAFVTVIVLLKYYLTKGKKVMHITWGCGYNRVNTRMQYTASSYAGPFLSMLKPLFKKIFDIEKPKNLFPSSAHFHLEIEDIEEAYIINPLLRLDEKFLTKFESLQSGNIQSYLKYGLVFLLAVIIVSLFIG